MDDSGEESEVEGEGERGVGPDAGIAMSSGEGNASQENGTSDSAIDYTQEALRYVEE